MLYIKKNELKTFINQCRKGWYWFALAFLGCMTIAALFIFVKSKKFEVHTSLNVSGGGSGSSSMMAMMAKSTGFGDILGLGGTEVDNELTIMQSHHVLYNAVAETGFNVNYSSRPKLRRVTYWKDSPILLSAQAANYNDTLNEYLKWKIWISSDGTKADVSCKTNDHGKIFDKDDIQLPAQLVTEWGTFTLQTTEYFVPGKSISMQVGWSSYTAAAQSLMEDMEFKLIDKKADIVGISYKDVNPNRTKDLLAAIVNSYNIYSMEAKNQSTQLNSEMLQNRIDTVAAELSDIEIQIEEYKRAHDLAYPELEAQAAVEQYADLKEKLIDLEVESSNIAMLQQYFKDPQHKYDPLPMILSVGKSSSEGSAIVEYNNAIVQYQSLKRTAIGDNPALKTAERNVETLRQSVTLTLQNLKTTIDKALSEARREESKIVSLKSKAPLMEREYINLVRQQELKQKILVMLLAQQEQNALTINQDSPKFQLVDEAYVDVLPSGPKGIVIVVIALFFSLFLPIAWMRFLDMLRPTLLSPEQLKKLEGFSGDIHTIEEGNEEDVNQLALELISRAKSSAINAVLVSMQGEKEIGTFASALEKALTTMHSTNPIQLIETPAFIKRSEVMYRLAEENVLPLLIVRQGETRKENLTYIETLIDKQLLGKNMLTAYIQ